VFSAHNADNVFLQLPIYVEMRIECGDFAGDGPDHQHPFLDGTGNVVIVRVITERGLGDGLTVKFHRGIIPCRNVRGKPRSIL